jgi:uncharacterized protein (TIGR02145 family)
MTAAVVGTDYQAPLAITTTGLGAATLIGATLNIPTPAEGLPSTGNNDGDMLYWNSTDAAWVKVSAGSNGQNLTFYNGAPIWIGAFSYSYAGATAYANPVLNPKTGKIWMDRNLGATRVATGSTDADSYGDLYQWGRGTDGHEKRTSGTTTGQSSSTTPGNTFITGSDNWYNGNNPNDLWQGVSGVNNPCPTGYRIPTEAEWNAESLSWSTNNSAGAFASPLKLPLAGYRSFYDGNPAGVGTSGFYWSSTVSSTNSFNLDFNSNAIMSSSNRAWGNSVRCIKD